MDFMSGRGPAAAAMFTASVFRSTVAAGPLSCITHEGPTATVNLWWGATVAIRPGDLVYFFTCPYGAALEVVLPPPIKPE